MEDEETGSDHGKKSLSKNSHLSISDSDSTISPIDSFHSPPRSEEPRSLHDPHHLIEEDDFEIDRNNSPTRKPNNPLNQYTEPKGSQPVFGLNKIVRERTKPEVKTVEPAEREERKASTLRRSERGGPVRVALILRILEAVSCLISFTVMASYRTQGWNGDSFVRHKEYRYCLAINVFGFIYSGFQVYNVAYNLSRQRMSHNLFYYLEFPMDQLLAYLLMSVSSSAATRVDDWITNWGSDKFTMMASASIGMSFLGFVAFSLSSLISGYILCNRDSGL